MPSAKKNPNPHAVNLGRLGGKARDESLTDEEKQAIARSGGMARARRIREAKKISKKSA